MAERGDIEETELVCTGEVVLGGESNGLAQVTDSATCCGGDGGGGGCGSFLSDIVLISFCDDKISIVVRTNVHACDNPLGKSVLWLWDQNAWGRRRVGIDRAWG